MRMILVASTAFALIHLAACSGATIDGGTTSGTIDSGAKAPDDAGGGDSGSRPCMGDPSCNADPQMSALAGSCSAGKCSCNPGYSLLVSGKCGRGGGLGRSCTTTNECASGFECLDVIAHPTADQCQVVGKQCTVSCDPSSQSSCSSLGSGVLCFAGCTAGVGSCGATL